ERLEHQQLGHDVVRRGVVDLHAEEDDALLEQLVVRVGLLDAEARVFDERRQDVAGLRARRRDTGQAGAGVDQVGHLRLQSRCEVSRFAAQLPVPFAWRALLITRSMKPYSRAWLAVNQRSRSASAVTCSTV